MLISLLLSAAALALFPEQSSEELSRTLPTSATSTARHRTLKPTAVATQSVATASRVYRIGEGAEPPVPISTPQPEIPPEMRRGLSSTDMFVYEGVVGIDGAVHDLRCIKRPTRPLPHPEVEHLFASGFLRWRYRPATLNGKPVRFLMTYLARPHFM